jgi:hypothetical protein
MTALLKLFRFHWGCGRQGKVEGSFVATQVEIDDAIGRDVYFGEILGKHSEICGTLDIEDVTLLTDDPEFVAKAVKYGLVPAGYNPLEYLSDDSTG